MNTKTWPGSITLILLITGVLLSACASAEDISQLHELIISFEDPKITAEDLAFYLVTHNYDAKPMNGYVELQANSRTYILIPNGDEPGLCDISNIDVSRNLKK